MAVWPPESLVAGLRALDRPVVEGLRWTTEDQWHVTLRFLGSLDSSSESGVRSALGGIQGGSVSASVGPVARRLGRAVWALPVSGLDELASEVVGATGSIGSAPEGRDFRGHITLARAKRGGAVRGLPAIDLSASWFVEEVTLVESTLLPTGARYDIVGRWSLSR